MEINVLERADKAKELFKQGYNCSQSVLMAFADVFNLEPTLAAAFTRWNRSYARSMRSL